MSTRSGRIRASVIETSPPRTRKGVSPVRSPARTRKSSPPAAARKNTSPARATRKSPARKSPSRKSPSRKPASKFPARKSPSRSTKENEDVPKSPTKRTAIRSEVSIKLEDMSARLETLRNTRSKRNTEYTIQDVQTVNNDVQINKVNGVDIGSDDVYGLRNRKPVEEVAPRRSSRLREFIENVPEIRRSISKSVSVKSASKSVSQSISRSVDTYSDEELSEEDLLKDKKPVTRKLATPLRESVSKLTQISGRWEFGGRIGSAILILLIPFTVFSILISCAETCSLQSLQKWSAYNSLSSWTSLPAFEVVVGQLILQAIISVTPLFGTKADRMDDSGVKYRFNATFAALVTTTILFGLYLTNLFNIHSLLAEYLRLAVASYIFAVILSIFLHLKSQKLDSNERNSYGNTGYTLYDFFIGRDVFPQIKKIDVKVWISRVCNINTLMLALLLFSYGFSLPKSGTESHSIENYKEFLSKVQLKPTTLLFCFMQISYILYFIFGEHKITTTFFWQSEGVGYLQLVSSALYPYYFTSISKFVVDNKLSLSTNALISASVLYMLGFLIMLLSNRIKHDFRKNPFHPSVANIESMPTFHGKKLIVSHLWGVVRHPNYAGDCLIHVALALPGILSGQYIAAAPSVVTILMLLHRSWRDHARCKRRYGAAWQRYCKRVPSIIIPKVL